MQVIKTNYPENISNTDKSVFEPALLHELPFPQLKIEKNCWLNLFERKKLTKWGDRLQKVGATILKQRSLRLLKMAAWVTDCYSGNYFHWMNDVLPKVLLLQQHEIDCNILLPQSLISQPFVKESLKLLDANWEAVPNEGLVIVKQMYFPLVGASGGQDPVYFPKLQEQIQRNKRKLPSKKLFISRQKAANRHLQSYELIESVLIEKGVEIVYPETLTLQEQIDLFGSATHLIGVHGAGLTNMMFMQPGSRVLEIRRNDDRLNYCYYFMANASKHFYYYLMVQGSGKESVIQADNLVIDIDKFRTILDQFLY